MCFGCRDALAEGRMQPGASGSTAALASLGSLLQSGVVSYSMRGGKGGGAAAAAGGGDDSDNDTPLG